MSPSIDNRDQKPDGKRGGSKRPSLIISIGAVILAIGIISAFVFGFILTQGINEGEVDVNDQQANPTSGLSPFYTQYIFLGLIVIGLGILAYGVVSRNEIKTKQAKQ